MERRKEEKILWIDSQNRTNEGDNTNNFYYYIGNILYVDNYKKLSVQLVDCIINKNYRNFAVGTTTYSIYSAVPFYTTMIKVYINFNAASNVLNNSDYGLLMGIISNNNADVNIGTAYTLTNFYYNGLGSIKLGSDNKIKYNLKDIPNGIININITGFNNSTASYLENYLVDITSPAGNAPSNVLLCLKFTYEF